jgi:hypothetical protein
MTASAGSRPTDPRVYAALGVIGIALFVAGIWEQVLAGLPYAEYARFAVAIAGGVLAMFGLGRWNAARKRPTLRGPARVPSPADEFPSMEIYSPETPGKSPRRPKTGTSGTLRHERRPTPAPAGVLLAAALLVAIAVLLVSNIPLTAASATTAPSPTASSPPLESGPPAPRAAPASTGTPPIPVCSIVYPPGYSPIAGLYPPLPNYALQSPCKVDHDEVHLTFASPNVGSGEQVKIPLYLPQEGDPGQQTTYSDFYVGMVVKGDPNSVGGQSYAEVQFDPVFDRGVFTWNVSLAVWAFQLDSNCVFGDYVGMNLSYENQFACVHDDLGDGGGVRLGHGLAGGQWANVTFIGSSTIGTQPLSVFFNDSTTPSESKNFTLTSAKTGTDTFQPDFAAACPSNCVLNWSTPFGLGLGTDLCEYPGCFSFNGTAQLGNPPFEVGSPEYWSGLSYSKDYELLGPSSASGACSSAPNVVPCDPYAVSGSYPLYTFNGTMLNFGTVWPWTTEDFGGASQEFNAFGTLNQFVPLFVDEGSNSSRADYVAPGIGLNVSARVQDLGHIASVNLSYVLPGGSPTNVSMSLTSGTSADGTYNGTVPGIGPNGTISFRIWATNAAGDVVGLPAYGSSPYSVVRSAIPEVTVDLDTAPASCGGLSLSGGPVEPNGTSRTVLAGFYSLATHGCYPYRFVGWSTTGGVTVQGSSQTARITVHSNGTVLATWVYYRPYDHVDLAWTPSGCGSIDLNGSFYAAASGLAARLLDGGTYLLGESACTGDAFSGWTVAPGGNLSILGDHVTVTGNGTLTATFVPAAGAVLVQFITVPSSCGGILVEGAGYPTNDTLNLTAGTPYPIAPDPCAGYGFDGNVSTTSGITVSNGELTATEAGTVTYSYYKLTLVTVATTPTTCGGILWDGSFYASGSILNVTNHTDHSLAPSPCADHYLEGTFAVTGNLSLEGTTVAVNGPGSIEATYLSGTPRYYLGFQTDPTTCGGIVFGGLSYTNSQFVELAPDSQATVSVFPCAGYGFVGWTTSGTGVSVVGNVVYVNSSGSLLAIFHPLVTVVVYTTPAACGGVRIAGTDYSNNATFLLPDGATYPIAPEACPYYALSSFVTSAAATIANGTLTLSGAATITAAFVPALYGLTLVVEASGCGSIVLGSVVYGNGSTVSLPVGAYSIAPDLCAGYELTAWDVTGNVSEHGSPVGTLTVNGPGTVTEIGAAAPPELALAAPSSAPVGTPVQFGATIAVPIPPYDYNFTWSFGDGTNLSTPSNETSHAYAAPGTYVVRVTALDPLGRTVTNETNVTIVSTSGAPALSVSPLDLAIILAAAVLIVAAAVAMVILGRRDRDADAAVANEAAETPVPDSDRVWTDEEAPGRGP